MSHIEPLGMKQALGLKEPLSMKDPLSILIVIPSLRGGGAERVTVDLASHWAFLGHEVVLLTQSDPSTDVYHYNKRIQRVSLAHLEKLGGLLGHIKKILAIRQVMRRFRPDIALGVMTTSSVYSVLAAQGLATKVIATEHAHPPSQKISSLWQRLRRFAYPRADAVVALTELSAQWLREHVPGCQPQVIVNAVHWPLQDSEPKVICYKPEGTHWLLAVGRLHEEKGFDKLIQAFTKISEQVPKWQLIILGEGAERENLQKQIHTAQMQERILLPGRVGNLSQWYKTADLFVLSSRFEGLSNSLQESMSYGLPAVSFDCDSGPREIIRDGIDGVLVRPDQDTEALANTLQGLMQDPARRTQLGEQAKQVRERFSPRVIYQQWDCLFDQLSKAK